MRRKVIVRGSDSLAGALDVPGDKSITHRALVFSALAEGRARLSNILTSADCLATMRSLQGLGVQIRLDGEEAVVEGVGFYGFDEPDDVLDVGNSGTALRLLPAVLAAQSGFSAITGDRSIRARPVDRVLKPLTMMGGRLWARSDNKLPPIAIAGAPLRGVEYRLPVASAQVKTAVLIAGLLAGGETTVLEPVRSRDHTEIMLEFLRAPIVVETGKGNARRIKVAGGRQFKSRDIDVPGDFSSAAFFLTAGALRADPKIELKDVGINPTRTGLMDVLEMMGATVKLGQVGENGGERVGYLTISRAHLKAAKIGGDIIPRVIDELPLAVLLATQADGETVITDAAELRVKETDRITLVAGELSKMGADIKTTPDGFVVRGPTPLTGAEVDSHGDHRLAMMLAVAATAAQGDTVVHQAQSVDVSFPGFFAALEELGAKVSIVDQ